MFGILRSKNKKKDLDTKNNGRSTMLSYQSVGQPVWTDPLFQSLVKSSYQRNPVGYRCVTLIARSVSSVPLVLYNNGVRVSEHALLDLVRKPNPLQGYNAFCESAIAYLLLAGNSYIEAVSATNSDIPEELYVLRPDRVRIIPGDKGFPAAYEYSGCGKEKRRVRVNQMSGQSPILHIKLFNPLDDLYGMSPLEVARQSIDFHNTVTGHNIALIQNEGRPSGALIVRNQCGLTDIQRQQLRDDLERLYAGGSNAGKMAVLEGDFEWKEMGLSPKDLDFIEGKNIATSEICQIFGVSTILAGVMNNATFSNYKEARLLLWEETVLPTLDLVLSLLNNWLTPMFGEDLRLGYDPDDIPALSPKREGVWDRIDGADFLTPNEKRSEMGFAPVDGGDALTLLHDKKESGQKNNISNNARKQNIDGSKIA
ncbi:phage portal protein [Candidatus Hydrogenosomobacter endosymbioticus]|uniref:Portal protein n=1 Tax=Candidatus Hydrogenosomobacter endosymbioticus TaxID=2558174 RepID=A0ABM7V828_9PROT|nr:phage portal protein [Candidatus Hydrogenosomobacter endosymbioticus]BDB95910.1 portal protein [Candidatus Hydrogenosomobacter endosymbioticus]